MLSLPRIAVGTLTSTAHQNPVVWALLDILERAGWHAQSFLSAAHLSPVCGARCITGQSQRHLDSWMMSRAACREIFQNGARGSDISVVEGSFASAGAAAASKLDTLADWLDLPKIAVVDVASAQCCRRLELPHATSGLLLDRVRDRADGYRWQTELESLYGVPVLGHLEEAPELRAATNDCRLGLPCRDLCAALGDRLSASLRLDKLLAIAEARTFEPAAQRLFVPPATDDTLHVAVAFDEAFHHYFADTLDLLEARGAQILDFSPLKSEELPWQADVVYLGGGPAEQHAEALSRNHCLKQSLRSFVARGGRIFAETSGLAYLCERMILPNGRQFPMAGILPAVALAKDVAFVPQATELQFGENLWLGAADVAMRGYLDPRWDILRGPDLRSLAKDVAHGDDLLGIDRVIGSRLQVDFAGQPHLVSNFFRPRLDALVHA